VEAQTVGVCGVLENGGEDMAELGSRLRVCPQRTIDLIYMEGRRAGLSWKQELPASTSSNNNSFRLLGSLVLPELCVPTVLSREEQGSCSWLATVLF